MAAILGNRDPDYGLLLRMEFALDVYDAVKLMHNTEDLTPEQFANIPTETRDFYGWLVKEGYVTGDEFLYLDD